MSGAKVIRSSYPVELHTERLALVQPHPPLAQAMVSYMDSNRDHYRASVPVPPPSKNTEELWRKLFELHAQAWEREEELRFLLFLRGDLENPMGQCSFTRIRRVLDSSCTLSFAIDHRHVGRGYASEAARAGISFMFQRLGLHRVDAEYKVGNVSSGRALERLGFTVIGDAPSYRFADGQWHDHNPERRGCRPPRKTSRRWVCRRAAHGSARDD